MVGDGDLDRAVDIAPLGMVEQVLGDQRHARHESEGGNERSALIGATQSITIAGPRRVSSEQLVDLGLGEQGAGHHASGSVKGSSGSPADAAAGAVTQRS